MRKVFAAPGNPGIARVAECVRSTDYRQVARDCAIDLTVVGPEAPLVAGIVDEFRAEGRRIVGPTAAAARLEGSKAYAKDIMDRAGVPTARYQVARPETAIGPALSRFVPPYVLKADGLAAGKGVVLAKTREEAESVLTGMLNGTLLGDAGRTVVVEDFCPGTEVSFIALTDGEQIIPFAPSQDHKAAFDQDQGPNTGGMGAYSADTILPHVIQDELIQSVMRPVIRQMAADGTPFTGFLYAGLMMTASGMRVLEFNARMGDPETQVLMHRLTGDLGKALWQISGKEPVTEKLGCDPEPSVCVVLASEHYPATPVTGDPIHGIAEAEATGAQVFHAGTAEKDGKLVTAGGRVLGVTARGSDLRGAISNAYAAVGQIHFRGMHYRRDIGHKGLSPLRSS